MPKSLFTCNSITLFHLYKQTFLTIHSSNQRKNFGQKMSPCACTSLCLLTCMLYLTCISSTTLPHQHPDPEAIVLQLQRYVEDSSSAVDNGVVFGNRVLSPLRGILLETNPLYIQSKDQTPCQTGNPVDGCWRCDPNWANDRQRLADCAVGFGQGAMGGKGGQIYIVSDPSDGDPENPQQGTLRHAVIQTEPLWIIFAHDMHINLKTELIVSSSKTIDGRGAMVHITGKGCIAIEHVRNIIIHGLYIHDCEPSGKSDGDGLAIKGVRNLWIDHCSFARCMDGLVDIIEGSTAVTVTNSYFTEHNKVMLLGHSDDYMDDAGDNPPGGGGGGGPPGCYAPGERQGSYIPGNIPGSPGGGPGMIAYCGGPGGRRVSGGIHTMARSSMPTTRLLSSLVVLSLLSAHM
ncbi:putative pectate lyase [Helianthus anomalus]